MHPRRVSVPPPSNQISKQPSKEVAALLGCALLALAVVAAYANHFENDFHFDDFHSITNNPFVRELRNIPRFFTDPMLSSTMPDHAMYRPVISTSLAIDYWLAGGYVPFYFHLSTMVWYVVQLALMFFLFRRIMDLADPHPWNVWGALFATACYGLHPANAETVNYIIQRADLYNTLGILASLLWYIADPPRRKYGWYLLPALAACLSKAPALIFPLIFFAYIYLFEQDKAPGERARWWGATRATMPALLAGGAAALLVRKMTPPAFNPGALSASLYRLTQPWVAFHYFKSFFLPTELSADSDWGYVSGAFSAKALVGDLFVVALLAAAVWTARRRETRPIAFGIIWFFLALVPTSVMPLAEVTNDHRMFFPFVGLALAVVWTCALWARMRWNELARWKVPLAVALGVALVAEAAGTRERNQVWRTEESLWRDVTVKSPANGRGMMNYGLLFAARGDYQTARYWFEKALLYTPNYWSLEINLGVADGGLHRDEAAERHFERALVLAPNSAESYFYYARWLHSMGRNEEAQARLEKGLEVNPLSFDSRHLLMEVYFEARELRKLDRLARDTQRLAPDDDTVRAYLEKATSADRYLAEVEQRAKDEPTAEHLLELSHQYYQADRFEECIRAAQKALALRPDYAEAYNNIAAAYNSMHRWDDGIRAAQEAVRIKPDYGLARNNLAWAVSRKQQESPSRQP